MAWRDSATGSCAGRRLASSVRPGPATADMPLPLLLALTPLPSDAFVPFVPPATVGGAPSDLGPGSVETFDAVGRATLLARDLPRIWTGSYRSYAGGETVPVQLELDSLTAMGQMVVLRGRARIEGLEVPVQGNLNAKSDQLDLLLLGDNMPKGVEPGGMVMGLEGLNLSIWQPPRLTTLGGRLQLVGQPSQSTSGAPASGPEVRGLW